MYTPPSTDVSDEKSCAGGLKKTRERSRRKRIALMVNELCTIHGVGTVLSLLVKDLSLYYDVHIITLWKDGDFAYNFPQTLKYHSFWQSKKRLRCAFFKTVIEIRKYLQEENIDVLVIHGRGCNIYPLCAGILTTTKIVQVEHFSLSAYDYIMRSVKERLFGYYLQSFLIRHLTDCIVTLTERELERYALCNKSHTFIYNPIDHKLLYKDNCDDNYAKESTSIITCGRIDYQKGYEYLIEVAAKILPACPEWQWHIYGGGDAAYQARLQEKINAAGLQGRVIFMGTRSDIYDVYPRYAFYVMTSRWEGFGMVLLEAKAKGLPLISFDVAAGPSDIIRDGVDGYLVPSFDIDAMAEKINFLIKHPEERVRLSANARGNLDKFSKEKIIEKWRSLIDQL